MSPLFKDLGVGVGLRPAHQSQVLHEKPKSIRWVEVISENFMPWKGRDFGNSIQFLSQIREHYPVCLHGVSMNIGSTDALDLDYMNRLKLLIQRVEPAIVSDHLSWTGVQGENLHDLMPIPYTEEALILIADKIDQVQNILGRRILIENPSSYFEFKSSEMSESEFIGRLLKKADCGLLLDVNNIYVSSVNHGFSTTEYLKDIPADRVGQMHLAGHSQMDGHLIDTHDAPICNEVWDLYQRSLELFGTKSVMVERDGNIPEWQELELEILKIAGMHENLK
jgi:uncharacterized protein (UPF0276 family)